MANRKLWSNTMTFKGFKCSLGVQIRWVRLHCHDHMNRQHTHPSTVSLTMSQISMLSPQSSDGREELVACSERETVEQT